MTTKIRFNDGSTRRYSLIKEWDTDLKRALCILKNPTAYANVFITDPTINLCVNKVQVDYPGEFGSVEIVNLYSIRKDEARKLNNSDRRPEAENISAISQALGKANWVLVGWGWATTEVDSASDFGVIDLLVAWKNQDPRREVKCFHDPNNGNYPQHPGYKIGIDSPLYDFPL